jgi:murein DD-endopeptidase MepM/ murein hydrolase activator NlpD
MTVIMEHGYGYKTIYAHVSKIHVRPHDRIKKGQVIANVGATGLVTAPSLHYEVWRYKKRIDPMPFLNLELFAAAPNVW